MTPFVEAARQLVRGLVWDDSMLPDVSHAGRRLVWRHHGLGALQAELSDTLRVHIWHPELVSLGMTWPRCVHDHRFDLTSAVVLGSIFDVPCSVMLEKHASLSGWEDANVYEIEHAKNQDRMVAEGGRSTAVSARLLANGAVWRRMEILRAAGTEYAVPRREFHTTRVEGLAVTVVHRGNFDDKLARVLCAPDSEVTAVSGIVRDDSVNHRIRVNWVLREAARAIFNMGDGQ
jgi:hypothetical protein